MIERAHPLTLKKYVLITEKIALKRRVTFEKYCKVY